MPITALKIPLLFLVLAVLGFNLSQRSHLAHGERKRFASLWAAGLLLIPYSFVLIAERYNLGTAGFWLAELGLIVSGVLGYLFRERIFIFRRRCRRCTAPLPIRTTLYYDDNLCADCREVKDGDSGSKQVDTPQAPYQDDPLIRPPEKNLLREVPGDVREFDWDMWKPAETAVICYIFRDDQVLLIHKKRGLGRGKINAPGGRIEPGEEPVETAIREAQEEVGLTPIEPYEVAQLSFVFTNGYSLKGHVFFAHEHRGELIETDEAKPFWVEVGQIPYHRMWEDDELWLPRVLDGQFVEARFIFDQDRMLSHDLIENPRSK